MPSEGQCPISGFASLPEMAPGVSNGFRMAAKIDNLFELQKRSPTNWPRRSAIAQRLRTSQPEGFAHLPLMAAAELTNTRPPPSRTSAALRSNSNSPGSGPIALRFSATTRANCPGSCSPRQHGEPLVAVKKGVFRTPDKRDRSRAEKSRRPCASSSWRRRQPSQHALRL